jgi:hypothetical protein
MSILAEQRSRQMGDRLRMPQEDQRMSVQLNHTIVSCRDGQRSATFLAEILGRPAPNRFGPFLVDLRVDRE